MSRKRKRGGQQTQVPQAPAPRSQAPVVQRPVAEKPVAATPPQRETPGLATRLRRKLRGLGEVLIIPGIIVGFLLAIYLLSISGQIVSLLHRETVTDTVVRSERVNNGESGKYLVFGKNEVYQNTDSVPLLKFRSSDFYRDIEVGKTYRFTVVGWRLPFFSTYRNIVGFEEVRPGAE
ncbi:MAG: hypothetical protein U0232_04545 [Thermomicrobiales bacterium]